MASKPAKKPLNYNYAQEKEFAESVMSDLMNIWQMLRGARAERELVWQASYRAWSVDRLEVDNQYQGRANLYWPQLRKEVETMTRRLLKGIFPDDYLKAETDKFEDEDLTAANTQLVMHYVDKVMKLPVTAEPWIKQGVIYGTSPQRTFWKKEQNEQFFNERVFKKDASGLLIPSRKVVQKMVTRYNGPVARAEDIFQTWIYPHNIANAADARAVFARTHLRWSELQQRQNDQMIMGINEELLKAIAQDIKDNEKEEKKSTYLSFINQFKEEGLKSTVDYDRNIERLLQFADSGRFDAIQDDTYFDLMEIWTHLKLPDTDVPVPVVVEVLNYSHVVRIQRNPYWHQSSPFDWFRFIKPPPGEYYGRGLPEAPIKMQAQLNDMLNQGMDSATLALNNITIINPAFAPNAESFEMEPGAQWFADPAGIKQFVFPDLSKIAMDNAQQLRGIISEMSDNSPQLPDPISGKARSTGQAQMAMDEWSTDMFAFIRSISTEGLNPMAQKIHMLCQQNLTDDDIIKVSGKYAGQMISRVVTPDDILGQYSFEWVTALQIQQVQLKTQQMLNFIKIFAQLPPQAQSSIKMNWENFLIKLLRDGFQIRDVTNIIETPRMTASVPPDLENRILKQGGEIKVTDSDDDDLHIESHTQAQKKLSGTNLYESALFDQHIQLHQQQKKAKAQAAQQALIQQQQMQAMAAAQSNVKSAGKHIHPVAPPGAPPPAGKPQGNGSQINESQNIGDMSKGMGSQNA